MCLFKVSLFRVDELALGLQEWLLRQVCASEAVEPVISSLVSVLLKGCQDSSPEARLLCGECLGELGAVDPGRLDLSRTDTNGDRNTFVVSRRTSSCKYDVCLDRILDISSFISSFVFAERCRRS